MKKYVLILFFFVFHTLVCAQQNRTVCLWDLTTRNSEPNISYVHAADHMLKVWGVPYVVKTSTDSVFNYGMIVASSRISSTTFTVSEVEQLKAFVSNGGIFIAGGFTGGGNTAVGDSLNKFFGINNTTDDDKRFRIKFLTEQVDPSFRWLNDPLEKEISLGNDSVTFTTRAYDVTTAQVMATFENGDNAIVRNPWGAGYTYLAGLVFRDLISLSQMDIDFHAERKYSNSFEPSADAFMLFLKAVYAKHFPYAVWKHTIPDKKKGSLIVTHDLDSQTAMDLVTEYSSFEYKKSIIATYNVTTRYFSDWQMGPFFLPAPNIYKLDSARIHCGHVIGNHSIGHFPDMDDEHVFEIGVRGHYDTTNYKPRYDGNKTTGGVIYAEVQLSKILLENRFPVQIRTWRSGNLTYPKVLNNLLDTIGYDFSSTNSANDVLTNFPFRARTNKSNSGTYTRVLEIPMTVSDVFYVAGTKDKPRGDTISEADMEYKVGLWRDVTLECANNYAPCILLIHPNRMYKLRALKRLLQLLPLAEMDLRGMESYGDFWNYRETVNFSSTYFNDTLKITIPSSQLPIQRKLGFVIDQGMAIDSSKILVMDEMGNPLTHYRYDWYENGKYILFEPASVWIDGDTLPDVGPLQKGFNVFNLYPNPYSLELKIDYSSDLSTDLLIKVYNAVGKLMFEKIIPVSSGKKTLVCPDFSILPNALYLVNIMSQGTLYHYKIIKE
ncbi:MAG: T9SS type A sorting domain-containing protein [Cytophagaceae bacterium]|nr:T9SS type A sorting domain-containing protein [Cytophagaceae bacterium]